MRLTWHFRFSAVLLAVVLIHAEAGAVPESRVCERLSNEGWRGVEPRNLSEIKLKPCEEYHIPENDIPKEFDARYHWRNCPSLWEVRDQGSCMSCWAVAIASVLTDRYCIASNGKKHFRFSEEDLLSCASTHIDTDFKGCDKGGSVDKTWEYLTRNNYNGESNSTRPGIVSGGFFQSYEGCFPTTLKPCLHANLDSNNPFSCANLNNKAETPKCKVECQDSYNSDVGADKRFVGSACRIKPYDDIDLRVMREIMTNGPVAAVMDLYDNFKEYNPTKDDVYVNKDRSCPKARHAMKIIGWGSQPKVGHKNKTVDYWIVSNSYNYFWGDGGFFKVVRAGRENKNVDINGKLTQEVTTGFPIIQ